MPTLQKVFQGLQCEALEAGSLYLPLVPRAKNWPLQTVHIPREVIDDLITQAPSVIFPFLFELEEAPVSEQDFNQLVDKMRLDRDIVIWAQGRLVVTKGGKNMEADARIEYCFARALLARLHSMLAVNGGSKPAYFLLLVDMLLQARRNVADFGMQHDEFRSCWLTLQGRRPWREGGFFSDVTVLVHYPGHIVRLLFGETEEDFDDWDRYGWMAASARDYHLSRIRRFPKS